MNEEFNIVHTLSCKKGKQFRYHAWEYKFVFIKINRAGLKDSLPQVKYIFQLPTLCY